MAYQSVIANESDGGVNRAQLEQACLLETSNKKLSEKKATGASSSRTSSTVGQPTTSMNQPMALRGHSLIAEEAW